LINHVSTKLREVKSTLKSIIGGLLVERKQVFLNKVNDLQTKNPYLYAFRKELCSSSISSVLGVVKDNYNDTITKHFSDMFNTQQGMTKKLPNITSSSIVKGWRFKGVTGKELRNILAKTKNFMSGYDNISVPLLKVLDLPSLQLVATAISEAIKKANVSSELGIGILLPLPKTTTPGSV